MGIETAAIIASAVVGAAGSMYVASKQEDAAGAAMEAQKQAEAEAEARRRADAQGQTQSESASTTYGTDKTTKLNETSNDLLIPKSTTGLGSSSNRVGLGF